MPWLLSEQEQAAQGKRRDRDDCLCRYCGLVNEKPCSQKSPREQGECSAPGQGPEVEEGDPWGPGGGEPKLQSVSICPKLIPLDPFFFFFNIALSWEFGSYLPFPECCLAR